MTQFHQQAPTVWLFVVGIALGGLLRTVQYVTTSTTSVSSRLQGVDTLPLQVSSGKSTTPKSCTIQQLQAINASLPDKGGHCSSNKFPWYNKCSITKITGCPDSSAWLDWHYQRNTTQNENFVAINIGCNKGFDAVNLLRMGSNDGSITRSAWNASINRHATMRPSNCQQNSDESQYQIGIGPIASNAVVFCVEPLTGTYTALVEAAQQTQFKGLHIRQLALNNEEPNTTLFPKALPNSSLLGAEKEGGGSCYSKRESRAARLRANCEPVTTMRLDLLVKQEVALKNAPHINVLLIDVEGWDFEVLLGGRETTLQRTQYIEFEYNWRGMWWDKRDDQPLREAVRMLDEQFSFTCYWPGGSREGQLWRITGCWLSHYSGLFWSNVVCVNRELAPALADRMEHVFLNTIQKDDGRQ